MVSTCHLDKTRVLTVPLSRFIQALLLAKDFDKDYPAMDQTAWLLDNWSFDDSSAHYLSKPLEIAPKDGPYTSFGRVAGPERGR